MKHFLQLLTLKQLKTVRQALWNGVGRLVSACTYSGLPPVLHVSNQSALQTMQFCALTSLGSSSTLPVGDLVFCHWNVNWPRNVFGLHASWTKLFDQFRKCGSMDRKSVQDVPQ